MDPFVDTTRIPVTDGEDTFLIKWKMDFGTKCLVEDTLTKMSIGTDKAGDLIFSVGAQRLALAMHNIVGWKGPKFDNVPCTPENIKRLDPDYPVFVKAQAEISRRNTRQEPTDPNSTTTGTQSSTENEVRPVDGSTPT